MHFRLRGLSAAPFISLYGLADEKLAALGAKRYTVDANPGFPDRIEMRDVAKGGSVLLVNHLHQPGETPFRSSHAIFVREGAERAYDALDEVPEVLRIRPLSVRAFDEAHWMVDADLCEGGALEPLIERFFADAAVSYLQVHYARRGCYAGRIDRA